MATATLEKPETKKQTVDEPVGQSQPSAKPPKAHRPKAAQLNVRIDPDLKAEGDRVLAQIGLSPSEAIRAFYEFVVQNRNDIPFLEETLLGVDESTGLSEEAQGKLKALEEARARVAELRGDFQYPEDMDWGEHSDRLKYEHFVEKGMILA